MKISEILKESVELLTNAGVENPKIDSKEIIAHSLKIPSSHIFLHINDIISSIALSEIRSFINRRANREPLQYIIGYWDFHDITLKMCEGVFIPRPETEELVEIIIKQYSSCEAPLEGFEIGAGTGAISLALLKAIPNLKMWACDINPKAVALSLDNAKTLNLVDRFQISNSSLFDEVNVNKKFDFIVSNPPYIDPAMESQLSPEISYEPKSALYCENKGYKIPAEIIINSPQYLKNINCNVFLEIADYNSTKLKELSMKHFNFSTILKDFSGLNRFIFNRL